MNSKIILVVDDSASSRQLAASTLQDAGYETIMAVDGKDAMIKLISNRVDLIISDLYMPNINGIEFTRKVRKSERFKYLPVIMMTTESQKDKVIEAINSGVTAWLLKPFTTEQILQITKKVIG